jgi:hypothetical protein
MLKDVEPLDGVEGLVGVISRTTIGGYWSRDGLLKRLLTVSANQGSLTCSQLRDCPVHSPEAGEYTSELPVFPIADRG